MELNCDLANNNCIASKNVVFPLLLSPTMRLILEKSETVNFRIALN